MSAKSAFSHGLGPVSACTQATNCSPAGATLASFSMTCCFCLARRIAIALLPGTAWPFTPCELINRAKIADQSLMHVDNHAEAPPHTLSPIPDHDRTLD